MADGQSTALVRAPITAGGQVAALVPQNFDDAWRIAGALAKAGMGPKDIDTQEKVLAVMMAGAEIGMPPFQALQSFAIINGRPALWGDGMMGVVRKHGARVEEWTTGAIEAGDFTAFCKVTRPDTGEVIQRQFSITDAKRAGLWQTEARVRRKNFKTNEWYEAANDSPWWKYPQRMIQMRARSWALRDGCADMLRGMKMAEEVQDIPPEDVRVIDSTGDNDQRPADERVGKYGVIGGQAGRDAYDDLAQRMSESEDAHALEIVWTEAERANLSANRMYALSEHYEACKEALENGRAPPPAPRFSEPPPPSPFAALKEAGERIANQTEFASWATTLTTEALGKCSESERAELRALYAAKKSAGAGGGEESAGSPQSVKAGAETPPSSSSPFEDLKEAGLAIVQMEGVRRRRSHYAAWVERLLVEKAQCSPLEQQELDRLQANIADEIGA